MSLTTSTPGQGVDALAQCLDTLRRPVTVFIRDDDAGWDDARLLALLDTTQRAGVPIDLAAIPRAVQPALARELCARIDADPRYIAIHTHGMQHVSHAAAPQRKCEFGPQRSAALQRRDLIEGRARLQVLFGPRWQPIFTPPWNRCAAHTPALLAGLGYRALSRDRGAPSQPALPELAVDVDWSKQLRLGGEPAATQDLARALRARARDGQPLGLMLHHATMGADDLRVLAHWLARMAAHPGLRWLGMAALLDAQRDSAPSHPEGAREACA